MKGNQLWSKKKLKKELEEKNYVFNNISWLSKDMGSFKNNLPNQGKNASEYANEGLATVGDAILKCVLANHIYIENKITTKGEIARIKCNLEKNAIMHELMLKENSNFVCFTQNK